MDTVHRIKDQNKLFLFLFLSFLLILRFILTYSQQTNLAGIEQNVIFGIQKILNGNDLYATPYLAPFSIIQYTPIYYFICAFTAKIFSVGAMDIHELYIIGRLWNIIFNLLTALFVCKISQNILNLSGYKKILIFTISFTSIYIQNFAVRPDSLHDLFGIVSIYYFLLYIKSNNKSSRILFLSIFTTALAMLSKQSGIQFLILFLGFTVWRLDWRTFLKIIIFTLIIYGTLLLPLGYLYPSFYENTIGGIANGINIKEFLTNIVFRLLSLITIWPFVIISCFFLIKRKSLFSKKVETQFLAVCLLGTLAFAGVTALKMGSTIQYFTVFLNLALIFILKSMEEVQYEGLNEKKLNLSEKTFNFYLISLLLIFSIYNIKYIRYYNFNPELNNQRISAIKAANYIIKDKKENKKKYVFANLTADVSIPSRQALNNIFFKNCVMPQMDILEYSTKTSKVIGYLNFENMLNKGEIGYIIESEPQLNFKILKNLNLIKNTKFKLVKNIDGYLIYKFSPHDKSN